MIYNVPVWDMTGAHKKSITVSIKLKYYFERAPQVRPRVLDRANLSAERRCSWGCGVSEDNIEGWGGCNWEWSTLLIVTNSDPVTLSHHNSGGTLYKTTNLRIIGIMMGDTLTHSHEADIQHTILYDRLDSNQCSLCICEVWSYLSVRMTGCQYLAEEVWGV